MPRMTTPIPIEVTVTDLPEYLAARAIALRYMAGWSPNLAIKDQPIWERWYPYEFELMEPNEAALVDALACELADVDLQARRGRHSAIAERMRAHEIRMGRDPEQLPERFGGRGEPAPLEAGDIGPLGEPVTAREAAVVNEIKRLTS